MKNRWKRRETYTGGVVVITHCHLCVVIVVIFALLNGRILVVQVGERLAQISHCSWHDYLISCWLSKSYHSAQFLLSARDRYRGQLNDMRVVVTVALCVFAGGDSEVDVGFVGRVRDVGEHRLQGSSIRVQLKEEVRALQLVWIVDYCVESVFVPQRNFRKVVNRSCFKFLLDCVRNCRKCRTFSFPGIKCDYSEECQWIWLRLPIKHDRKRRFFNWAHTILELDFSDAENLSEDPLLIVALRDRVPVGDEGATSRFGRAVQLFCEIGGVRAATNKVVVLVGCLCPRGDDSVAILCAGAKQSGLAPEAMSATHKRHLLKECKRNQAED